MICDSHLEQMLKRYRSRFCPRRVGGNHATILAFVRAPNPPCLIGRRQKHPLFTETGAVTATKSAGIGHIVDTKTWPTPDLDFESAPLL